MNDRKTIGNNPFATIKSIKPPLKEGAPSNAGDSELSNVVYTIGDTIHEFSEMAEELNKNSSKLEKQTNQASNALKQLSHNVLGMGSSLEKLKSGIKKISASSANSTKSSISALKSADTTNNVFSNLLESSKDLDKIDKVVAGLAQQINLFALNASIEAARAGEAGRGFAVVANEIKELAKETNKIADDIRYKIENFYQDSKKAVESMNEISSQLLSIKNNQNSIDLSLEEQTNSLTEIAKNSSNVVKSSNSVTDNILNVYKLAKVASEGTEKSLRYSNTLANLTNDLKTLLDNK